MQTKSPPQTGPAGLGGWLILVALGLVVTPVRTTLLALATLVPIFRDGTWHLLTTAGTDVYHPVWAPLILAEIIINLLFIVGAIILLVLFFRKSVHFPRLFIFYLGANLVFVTADAFAIRIILPAEPVFDRQTTIEFGRALFSVLIWIPYMLLSDRVKNTFLRRA